MGKYHRNQPPGSRKQEQIEIKPVVSSENLEGSENMRKKSAKDEERMAASERAKNSIRGTEKNKSKNAGEQ